MKIVILDLFKIRYFDLPSKIDGSFLIYDDQKENTALFSIEAVSNNWIMFPTDETKIINGNNSLEYIQLLPYNFYKIQRDKEIKIIYTMPLNDITFSSYKMLNKDSFTIGQNNDCNLVYNNPYVLPNHAKFLFDNGTWHIQASNGALIYVNNIKLNDVQMELKNGDFIFIYI